MANSCAPRPGAAHERRRKRAANPPRAWRGHLLRQSRHVRDASRAGHRRGARSPRRAVLVRGRLHRRRRRLRAHEGPASDDLAAPRRRPRQRHRQSAQLPPRRYAAGEHRRRPRHSPRRLRRAPHLGCRSCRQAGVRMDPHVAHQRRGGLGCCRCRASGNDAQSGPGRPRSDADSAGRLCLGRRPCHRQAGRLRGGDRPRQGAGGRDRGRRWRDRCAHHVVRGRHRLERARRLGRWAHRRQDRLPSLFADLPGAGGSGPETAAGAAFAVLSRTDPRTAWVGAQAGAARRRTAGELLRLSQPAERSGAGEL